MYPIARTMADSDSRPLGIRRRSIPELELFSKRHPAKQNLSSHRQQKHNGPTANPASDKVSPNLLARASSNLVGSAHPCEFTFILRKFAEPAHSRFLQPCRVCSPVRVHLHASQVRRTCSLALLATLSGLLTHASSPSFFASSPNLLARASCNLAGSAHLCEFTFILRKFAEPARSRLLQPCRVCSPVRVHLHSSQVRRTYSLALLATLPGLLTRASSPSFFASSPNLLTRASCHHAGSPHPSPNLLARASCNLVGFAHPCEFTFILRKFAEPARSRFLQPCRVSSPVRVHLHSSQVRRTCSLALLATLPSLLTRASSPSFFASSPSQLARASCHHAGSPHPCAFTFMLRKFAEPAHSRLLQPCRVSSPVRVHLHSSQVRRTSSLAPLATMPGLLTRASSLSCFASLPSQPTRASCNLAGSAHPCQFTFMLRKFAEPPRSRLLQLCQVCSPVRVYFHASQVCRASPLAPLATLPGLLTRASLLSCFASSPSQPACASCNLAGTPHPCEFTFMLRKFAEPARSRLLQPCRNCSPVPVYFHASQVRRTCSLALLATLSGLLTRASSPSCFASSPNLLARASCNLAESAHPCEFTFMLLRRASSLAPLATLPGLLTRASLLSCFASLPTLLARASYNLAGTAHPCQFTFMLRKFAEPARSRLLPPCHICSPVRVFFDASQVRRACSLAHLATLPGLLTRASLLSSFTSSLSQLARASCNLPGLLTRASLLSCFVSSPSLLARASCNFARSAHPCEFTFMLRKFADLLARASCHLVGPAHPLLSLLARASCNLAGSAHPCKFTLMHHMLARASCNLAGSAHPCEFTFMLGKFAEPVRSRLLQTCRVRSPVRVYFHSSQVRRACSLAILATLPYLLTRASFISCFASSPSLLAHASCNLAGSAHPCEFTFMLRKFAEPARSRFLQPCRVCSLVRVHFDAFSSSLFARASCNLAGSSHPYEFTFMLHKFADPARSRLLPPCHVCSPVRVFFDASQVRRACSLVLLATLPGLLVCSPVRVFYCASHKFAEPARSYFLQPCRVYSPVRVVFYASQVCRACSLVLHATLMGLLTRVSFFSCFVSLPSLLTRASCDLAGSAHPYEFTFMLRKFAKPARSRLLPACRVYSPVRVFIYTLQVRRACSLAPLAALQGLLTHGSLLTCSANSSSRLAHFAETARSRLLQACRVCSPVRVFFDASQVLRACSLAPLATLPDLLTRASFLLCFASSPNPARSWFMQPCRDCSPARVYFHTLHVRRAYSLAPLTTLPVRQACLLVLLATLPSLLTLASLLSCFASSPSLLALASYHFTGSAHPCEFSLMLCKFTEPARTCFLQPYRVCSPMRVYFHASQVLRARLLVLLVTLPGLLTRASFLLCFARSPSLLTCASGNLTGPARPCISQVRCAYSLVLLATLQGLLTRASLLSCFTSSPSLLARASCNLVGSAHPWEFTFMLRKFADPARSRFFQPCRLAGSTQQCDFSFMIRKFAEPARSRLLQPGQICSPVRVFSCASQVRRASSVELLATSPSLLTRASLLSCFASSPSLPACAFCHHAGSAHPCEFSFMLRKFDEPARSCFWQPGRACSLVHLASSSSLLARASSNLTGSTHPFRRTCSFVLLATLPVLLTRESFLSRFASSQVAEPARSCFLQPCRICSPLRVYFHASQVRRPYSLTPLTTLPGLLTRASFLLGFVSSPSLLPRESCKLAGSARPYKFSLMLRKFAKPALSRILQPCRVCTPVRVFFYASQVRRACLLVLLATWPSLPSRASRQFVEPARSCLLQPYRVGSPVQVFFYASRKFAEHARSYFLQPCRLCSPVRIFYYSSQVREPARSCFLQPYRVCSLVRVFYQASQARRLARVSCNLAGSAHPFASSLSLLPRESCNLAGSAHPCKFTFMLCKFAEPARSRHLPPCRVYLPVRVFIDVSQLRRACSLMLLATLPDLFTRASLLSCFASSPSLLARATFHLAESPHPCQFSLMFRKFAEPALSRLLPHCRVCSPVRVYFHASQVRRACSLVLLATLPALLTRASLLSCFASSPSLLARASCNLASSSSLLPRESCNLAGSTHLCELSFMLRKFAKPARSCFMQPCQVCSPVRVFFYASQVPRACSLVLLATLPGLLTRASLLSCFASSLRLHVRASCKLARSAHPCEFTFMLCKFTEAARSCFMQPCQVCSPVRVFFYTSQVSRACSLVFLATLPGLLARASRKFTEPARSSFLQSCQVCSPVRVFFCASCKSAEPARSYFLLPCRVWSPVRVFFYASQVCQACSLVLHATLMGLLTRESFFLCFASSPSLLHLESCNLAEAAPPCLLTCESFLSCFVSSPTLLARASSNLVEFAHPCKFTVMLRKFTKPARSRNLPPCRVCSPVRVFLYASQVPRACSLANLATLPGLLTCASFLLCFASSPSLLTRESCNLAGSTHPCEFSFMLRNFVEPARSCFLQPCRVCSPVRVYFHLLQVRGACSLAPLATLPSLLTRASFLLCFASLPSLLARASSNLTRLARLCISQVRRARSLVLLATLPALLTCLLACASRKFAEHARSYFLQPCRLCSPQPNQACSPVHLASSPSTLARTSCNLAGSAHLCEFSFILRKFVNLLARASSNLTRLARLCISQVRRARSLVLLATLPALLTCLLACASRKFAEHARSYFLQPCRLCSPSLVLLATLPALLTRASLLSSLASSRSLLARATCHLAESAHPCEFSFMLRKFPEPAPSRILQPCRVCSPVRVFFYASQFRRACSLVLLATLPGLFTRASLLSSLASSQSLLARATCHHAESAHPCEFSFMLRKFIEPVLSRLLPHCRVCSPVRVYFHASQVCRACSFMLHSTLPSIITRASLLSCFASSPSLLARASCNLARLARLCISQVRQAGSHVVLATLPGLLTRESFLSCFVSSPTLLACASCNLVKSAHPCKFTVMLRKFAKPARSCLLLPCRVCSPVRVFFYASQVRRACSLVNLATLLDLLTHASFLLCFANSPSLLARASCNLAGSVHPCEFTFILCKFAEPARSHHLPPCRVCSPVRVFFYASQVRRACSLVLLATLPGLLTRASLLSYFAGSPSLLARASCNLAGSTHPCEFTFILRRFAEPTRSCFLQPCRVYSPVRVYFHTSQVRRAYSLVLLATLPGLLTRASLLSYFAGSPSLLARASCNLASSPASSRFLQPCQVCSPVRVFFHASQVRRAGSLAPLASLPSLLTRASFLLCFASSPSLLARTTCHLAESAHPCEFSFMLRKFAEPALSLLLPHCRVCSPVRVYFYDSQVRRAYSLVLLTTLPGLLTRANLLSCFAVSRACSLVLLATLLGLLARASLKFAESARSSFLQPCQVCSPVRVFFYASHKFAEPARLYFLQPCRVCSPVQVFFYASQFCRACSLVLHATLMGLLNRESFLSCFASSPSLLARASCNLVGSTHPYEFTFMLRKFAEPARSRLLPACRVYSPVRVFFYASQVHRACSLAPFTTLQVRRACTLAVLATLPGLLTRANLHSCFPSSPSLLTCASCQLAGSTHPCEFSFMLRKFVEPTLSRLLQPCRICSPGRVFFYASQVRRTCSLVLLATLPGLLTRVSLLSYFASSPSLLARASCHLAGSVHPCEFSFMLREFADPALSCFWQPCWACPPMLLVSSSSLLARASFNLTGSTHPFRRAYSLVLLATLPGLLTLANLLSCFASSPSLLALASCHFTGFAEPTRSCFLQPCRVFSPVRVFFYASQVRRACSLVLLATLPGLLARASRKFAEPAHSCFLQPCRVCSPVLVFFYASRKFADPARSYFLQPCRVCSPLRDFFYSSKVCRACSLVLLATLLGLLTRESFLSCFTNSPTLLARASCNLAGSAHPCKFTFMLRKFTEPARSLLLTPCWVCSPVRVYFYASQVHRSCSLAPSFHLVGFAHPCEFTFMLRKFAEPARSRLLQPCRGLLTCAGFLLCFASLLGLLTNASCKS
ncbi:hypothetical protein CRG98_009106 [Punica granatum]|uniref:Uncharacterized protein n=1 Tax=Punica granatum TaxID=22663 RepID=A0A2I0KQ58_PUNGR|nr:hypothetical protein CRG98_009106 [Punica granatum]